MKQGEKRDALSMLRSHGKKLNRIRSEFEDACRTPQDLRCREVEELRESAEALVDATNECLEKYFPQVARVAGAKVAG